MKPRKINKKSFWNNFPVTIVKKFQPKKSWDEILKACVNAEAEVESLQNEIEQYGVELVDMRGHIDSAVAERNDFRYQRDLARAELKNASTSHTKAIAGYETRISKLSAELAQTESNRAYACNHIQEQNKLIRDAKTEVQNLRDGLKKMGDARSQADHLAKKVVELQAESVRSKFYLCSAQQAKTQLESKCGTCVACKLDAANDIIARTADNVMILEHKLRKVCEELQFKSIVLDQTAANLAKANEKMALDVRLSEQAKQDLAAYKESVEVVTGNSQRKIKALEQEKGHLYNLVNQQRDALELIARGAIFKHADIARTALVDAAEFKLVNRLMEYGGNTKV